MKLTTNLETDHAVHVYLLRFWRLRSNIELVLGMHICCLIVIMCGVFYCFNSVIVSLESQMEGYLWAWDKLSFNLGLLKSIRLLWPDLVCNGSGISIKSWTLFCTKDLLHLARLVLAVTRAV